MVPEDYPEPNRDFCTGFRLPALPDLCEEEAFGIGGRLPRYTELVMHELRPTESMFKLLRICRSCAMVVLRAGVLFTVLYSLARSSGDDHDFSTSRQ